MDDRTFTVLRSHVHPDRVQNPEQKARYKTAFEVLSELEGRLVDKDQAFLANEKWDHVRKKKPEAKKARLLTEGLGEVIPLHNGRGDVDCGHNKIGDSCPWYREGCPAATGGCPHERSSYQATSIAR